MDGEFTPPLLRVTWLVFFQGDVVTATRCTGNRRPVNEISERWKPNKGYASGNIFGRGFGPLKTSSPTIDEDMEIDAEEPNGEDVAVNEEMGAEASTLLLLKAKPRAARRRPSPRRPRRRTLILGLVGLLLILCSTSREADALARAQAPGQQTFYGKQPRVPDASTAATSKIKGKGKHTGPPPRKGGGKASLGGKAERTGKCVGTSSPPSIWARSSWRTTCQTKVGKPRAMEIGHHCGEGLHREGCQCFLEQV